MDNGIIKIKFLLNNNFTLIFSDIVASPLKNLSINILSDKMKLLYVSLFISIKKYSELYHHIPIKKRNINDKFIDRIMILKYFLFKTKK